MLLPLRLLRLLQQARRPVRTRAMSAPSVGGRDRGHASENGDGRVKYKDRRFLPQALVARSNCAFRYMSVSFNLINSVESGFLADGSLGASRGRLRVRCRHSSCSDIFDCFHLQLSEGKQKLAWMFTTAFHLHLSKGKQSISYYRQKSSGLFLEK